MGSMTDALGEITGLKDQKITKELKNLKSASDQKQEYMDKYSI